MDENSFDTFSIHNNSKIKAIALAVTGFPNTNQPSRGIFNYRTAIQLSRIISVKVIYYRVWLPGRPLLEKTTVSGIDVFSLFIPQLPGMFKSIFILRLNLKISRLIANFILSDFVKDCSIIHSSGLIYSGIINSFLARKVNIPHVVQIIGSDINDILPLISDISAVKNWLSPLHGVSCNSKAILNKFRNLFPKQENVELIYRGVNLNDFSPAFTNENNNNKSVRFLFLGGFPNYSSLPERRNLKGGETLLKAWQCSEKSFDNDNNPPYLLLAGIDSQADFINKWKANLQHPEQVELLGFLKPKDIKIRLHQIDAVLMPSLSEGLPNVALEAAASGKPVFGSRVGSIPETLIDGQSGLLIPPNDVDAWCDVLIKYSHDVKHLNEMGIKARHFVEEHFDTNDYVPKLLKMYKRAMELFDIEHEKIF